MFTKGDYYIDVEKDCIVCRTEDGKLIDIATVAQVLEYDEPSSRWGNEQLICAAPQLFQCTVELFELLRTAVKIGGDMYNINLSQELLGRLLEESATAHSIAVGWKDKRKYGPETTWII